MSTSLPPLQVFLVEVIQVIRENMIVALSEVSSAEVIAVAVGETEAVDWLSANPNAWQLAVVDLFLKEGSGIGVVNACRSRSPTQRVVVLTNFATPAIRERCMAAGADHVFDKSTELDDFLAYCSWAHGT